MWHERDITSFHTYKHRGTPTRIVYIPATPKASEPEVKCVFCGETCEPAPTKDGWLRWDNDTRMHFQCARKIADVGNGIDKIESPKASEVKKIHCLTIQQITDLWDFAWEEGRSYGRRKIKIDHIGRKANMNRFLKTQLGIEIDKK